MNLEPHRSDPYSQEIVEAAKQSGANIHNEADYSALLKVPIEELPPVMARARREIDQAEAARSQAESNLRCADERYREYNNLLAEIASRRNRLQGDIKGLAEHKAVKENAPANFSTTMAQARNQMPGYIENFIQRLITSDKWIELLPGLIKAEESALSKLESQAAKMARDYELH